jgi:transcriptional regulator with GAF, ATPase, and Fis domain
MSTAWLRAADCPLLQPQAEAEPLALRLVQRLLELALVRRGSEETAAALLEEIAAALQADAAGVWEMAPAWKPLWQHVKRGTRGGADAVPKQLLGEVLDREVGVRQETLLATCLSFTDRPNRVLVVQRPRPIFEKLDLEYAVAAGHYLGVALERSRAWDAAQAKEERLQAVLAVSRRLGAERETVPLLEHIAAQAAKLLHCERASIFVWDKARQELVGRPALGLPNGELRIPDDTGVVGKTVRSGEALIVQDVHEDPNWTAAVDQKSDFQTRNLLCVPMRDGQGQPIGALEVMNKAELFTEDDTATLEAFAAQTATALDNVREREMLLRTRTQLEGEARLAAQLVGASPALVALRGTIDRVARTDLPVLVLGESGTGKDVVARAVHFSSARHQHPYIPVNCAAIAETLIESELFGHEKGAFTGADATRAGKFEAASGGTLFLDEIGDLSAGGQAKLLRVLEEKVVYRVGGAASIPVDTRIVAATNRNLAESVRSGKFREDLFYRLTVVTLDLPPLRDRHEDILVLAEHFLAQFCRQAGRKPLKLSAEAKKRLEQHSWPGNVRELRNLLERVAYLCPHDKIDAADLAFILRPAKANEAERFAGQSLAEATDAFQREHIEQAISRAGGHMSDAALALGLHRPNLYRKMKMLGMKTE